MKALGKFLECGTIGPVHVGMRRAEVFGFFGPSSDASIPDSRGRVGVMRWGDLEIGFDGDRATYVGVMLWGLEKGTPPRTPAVDLGISAGMTPDEFRSAIAIEPKKITASEVSFSSAVAYFDDGALVKIISTRFMPEPSDRRIGS